MTSGLRDDTTLLVATRNSAKGAELDALAASLGRRTVTLSALGVPFSTDEDALEVHATFEANALAKARYYHRIAGGRATVADDSGLEVSALGGAPGVHSRRWAGASGPEATVAAVNNAALLEALTDTADRTARFVCVVAYVDALGELTARGEVRGRIAASPRGLGGFGYDPLFEADELGGRTFGEVSPAEKARVSHRARALGRLADRLAVTGRGRR